MGFMSLLARGTIKNSLIWDYESPRGTIKENIVLYTLWYYQEFINIGFGSSLVAYHENVSPKSNIDIGY